MKSVRAAISIRLMQLEDRALPAGVGGEDMVLQWHTIALDAVRDDHALSSPREQFGPTRSSRALGIVQAAVYDAVNSIDGTYEPYLFSEKAAPGASIEAAAAQAAHDALVWLYPSRAANFDAALKEDLAAIPQASAQAGAVVGRAVAAKLTKLRANDGANEPSSYVFRNEPTTWSPDPLHPNQQALTPNWGRVAPFTMTSGDEFRPEAPPDSKSDEYAAAFQEVVEYGGDGTTTPTKRSEEQTEIGIFWGYDGQPGLCSPPRLYNQIVAQIARDRGNTMIANARLLALVNLAQADAAIASWDAKYAYDLARPITAIRQADRDGNPDTIGDPTWAPYGAPANNGNGTNFTPPFPAYTSGHATFGGAVFETLRDFYGTDDIAFTFLSDEFNGKTFDQNGVQRPLKPRSFASLSQAEEENGQSRIYLGIHWAFDKTAGIKQGNQIADRVFSKFLRVKPDSVRQATSADVGGGPRVQVRDGEGTIRADFFAFDPSFTGGVRTATNDVNADGIPDLVVANGPGMRTTVRVFDGVTFERIAEYQPFEDAFTGGAEVASADVDADGYADVIVGAGETGGPRVQVFSGRSGQVLQDFFAFDSSNRSGVRIAAADLNDDGRADVVACPGVGGGPLVRIFDGATFFELGQFLAANLADRAGVFAAVGDCDGDGRAEIITSSTEGMSLHRPDGTTIRTQAQAEPTPIACVDLNGDGRADLAIGRSTAAEVRTADDWELLSQFRPFAAYVGRLRV